jgi:carboxylesterase type B
VTIIGESAGGIAVSMLCVSHLATGLFGGPHAHRMHTVTDDLRREFVY